MRLQVSGGECAHVLRVIGQDLADLFPEQLEIEVSGGEFVARGRSRANLRTPPKNEKPSALRNVWGKLSRSSSKTPDAPSAPSQSEFVRTYTPKDIKRLDESGAARRRGTSEKPDLYSLEERLRMIGRIVDEKNVELVKLIHDSNTVSFYYRGEDGQMHSESCSTLELYKLQQEYYSGRRVSLIDPWQGTRR